jgi:hypothetical protein
LVGGCGGGLKLYLWGVCIYYFKFLVVVYSEFRYNLIAFSNANLHPQYKITDVWISFIIKKNFWKIFKFRSCSLSFSHFIDS